MASTRKADEKSREVAIIGNVSHQILGAKLPSNRQVLQVLFYNIRFVKLNAKESAKLAIDAVLIFWNQARIPTRKLDKCITKLLNIYEQWETLRKRDLNKLSAAMKVKYDDFVDDLDNLFDIAHANAMELMCIDEDKIFMEQQRQKGRPGSMLGIDKKLADKEERSRLRKEQEEAKKIKYTHTQTQTSTMQQTGKYFVWLIQSEIKSYSDCVPIFCQSCIRKRKRALR